MASKMTSRGTPFSLATASTTSKSSLRIWRSSRKDAPRHPVVSLFRFLSARRGLRLRRIAEGHPVGNHAGAFDVRMLEFESTGLALDHNVLAVYFNDVSLQAPATLDRGLQQHLDLLAVHASELLRREQGAVDTGGGDLQYIVAGDRIFNVQVGRELAARGPPGP